MTAATLPDNLKKPEQCSCRPVTVSMATTPARAELAAAAAAVLAPQCDCLMIYMNGEEKDVGKSLRNKLQAFADVDYSSRGDLADNGKFLPAEALPPGTVHATVDDDIIYPADYIEQLLAGLNRNRGCVVSFHGSIPAVPSASYYHNRVRLPCLEAVDYDTQAVVPGSGAMAYVVRDDTRINISSDFPVPYMSDIWAGIWCLNHELQVIVLQHEAGWIKDAGNNWAGSICEQFAKSDRVQTWAVNYHLGRHPYYLK